MKKKHHLATKTQQYSTGLSVVFTSDPVISKNEKLMKNKAKTFKPRHHLVILLFPILEEFARLRSFAFDVKFI